VRSGLRKFVGTGLAEQEGEAYEIIGNGAELFQLALISLSPHNIDGVWQNQVKACGVTIRCGEAVRNYQGMRL
jgi:hypothetical protein